MIVCVQIYRRTYIYIQLYNGKHHDQSKINNFPNHLTWYCWYTVDSDHTAKLGPNLVPDIRPPKIPAATFLQGASLAAGRARIPPGFAGGKGFQCPKDH